MKKIMGAIAIMVCTSCVLVASTYGYPSYIVSPKMESQCGQKVLNPDTLVLAGGGAKGVACAGVLKYLQESGKLNNISRFAGASSGSIFSFLYYLGLPAKETDKIISGVNWSSFLDSNIPMLKIMNDPALIKKPEYLLFGALDLILNDGLAKGDVAENLLRQTLINEGFSKTGHITFAQLKKEVNARIPKGSKVKSKDLFIFTCSLGYTKTSVFSAETTPNFDVVDAVRASFAIPFVFTPVKIDANGKRVRGIVSDNVADILVDGGTTYDYPIEYFDKMGAKSLGFVLQPESDFFNPKEKVIKGINRYAADCLALLMDNIGPRIMNNAYRTVFIDTNSVGVGTLSFDMTKAQENAAINQGYQATKEYFEGL